MCAYMGSIAWEVDELTDEWIPNVLHEYAKYLNYDVILFLVSPTARKQLIEAVQTMFPKFIINQLESIIVIREMKNSHEE